MDYSQVDYSKSIGRIERIVVTLDGFLEKKKKTIKHKDLDRRWCVLGGTVLRIYRSEVQVGGMPEEELQVTGTAEWKDKSQGSVFKAACAFAIVTKKHTYQCIAPTGDEKQKWVKAIAQGLEEDKRFLEEVAASSEVRVGGVHVCVCCY